ncbi:phosphatase 2C-like domain-containing protein [Blastocladiella britannica]|nr:phosphatase 2C-like domain-containing protein [Blastocladiella britannica]
MFGIHGLRIGIAAGRGGRRGYATATVVLSAARAAKYVLVSTLLASGVFAYDRFAAPAPPLSPLATDAHGEPVLLQSASHQYVHRTLTAYARVWRHETKERPSPVEIHSTCVASNDPIEDRHTVAALGPTLILGVHDGHSGWQCADTLANVFHNYIGRHLTTTAGRDGVSGVARAMVAAYDEFDTNLMALPDQVQKLGNAVSVERKREMVLPGMVGAVSISAVVDGKQVTVAHAGDCRAVIGRRRSTTTGDWESISLTEDHDVHNPSEVVRVQGEHPGEVPISRGRILGRLAPFRACGDGRYKWSVAIHEWLAELFDGAEGKFKYRTMPKNYLTPPYVTAHPDIATHDLAEEDEFMVIACDGLWERVSAADVVSMVGAYVDGPDQVSDRWAQSDRHAAAHVIRNAIGGKDTEQVASTLRVPAPLARSIRDDLTVVVVFFRPISDRGLGNSPLAPTAYALRW